MRRGKKKAWKNNECFDETKFEWDMKCYLLVSISRYIIDMDFEREVIRINKNTQKNHT